LSRKGQQALAIQGLEDAPIFALGFITMAGVTFACIPSKSRVNYGADLHREKHRDKGLGVIDLLACTAFKSFGVNPEIAVRQGIRSIWVFI
jgi:hypothetical protein